MTQLRVYDGIEDLVGGTPLVRLSRLEKKLNVTARLYSKMESYNPAGSAKDRIALRIIKEYERTGVLKEGGTIIESSSGNTGIGLAAIGTARGYRVIIVMPENMSEERIALMRGYGAEVVLTSAAGFMPEARQKAIELEKEIAGAVRVGQGSHPDNPEAHYLTTGPEIWDALNGAIDAFIGTVGTGGTLTGIGRYLREKNPDVGIFAVEPEASPVLNGGKAAPHRIQGIGPPRPSEVLDQGLYDEVFDISDEDAFKYARLFARTEGLSVGISSGAALCAAVRLGLRNKWKGRSIVFVSPDSGERYLSGGIY